MTNEEMHTALYDKFSAEQEHYRAWLLKQPPEEILNHTYQYTVQQDILELMSSIELSPQQTAALLWAGVTLGDIYKSFTNIETEYMTVLQETVENKADDILRQADEMRSAPVYPYPLDYAIEQGELDQYQLSRKANIACKEAIEQAIAEHYADNCLDTATAVRQVADTYGYDRMLYVLAVTVQHKSWDGRFSDSNKAWAATVPVMEDRTDGSADRNVYYVVDRAHPGLTDLFLRAARKAQAQEKAKEQQAAKAAPTILEKLKKPLQKNAPNNSAHLSRPEL